MLQKLASGVELLQKGAMYLKGKVAMGAFPGATIHRVIEAEVANRMLQSLRLGLTFGTNIVDSLEIVASTMTMDMGCTSP
jgi:hypothetical protein